MMLQKIHTCFGVPSEHRTDIHHIELERKTLRGNEFWVTCAVFSNLVIQRCSRAHKKSGILNIVLTMLRELTSVS